MSLWRGLIAGLVGGTIAAGAMSVVNRGLTEIGVGARQQKPPAEQQQDEDAALKVADGIARRLLRRPLPKAQKPLAGNLVHYAFGASIGALYGGVAAVVPRVTAAVGLPFGFAVWLGAHVITVPALGSQSPQHGGRVRRKDWSSSRIWATEPPPSSCAVSSARRCRAGRCWFCDAVVWRHPNSK
jgi:uncharacterized membrane protein YagU involved in acid resistance